jgi:hypothetical protein
MELICKKFGIYAYFLIKCESVATLIETLKKFNLLSNPDIGKVQKINLKEKIE